MKARRSARGLLVRFGFIGALLIGATSCSIDAEGSPRDIPKRDQGDLRADFDQPAGDATGSGRIYLLSPEVIGQPRTLQSVARDVGDTPDSAMTALFEGPNTDELQKQLRSAIPPGTRVLDVSRNGSVLVVNLSNELQQLTGEALIDGVAEIVLTGTEVTGISSVSIQIDGVPQQWPAASGTLQSEPLTRYDFPGLVLSSQPAFPSVPSPAATPP
ncbi:MAG TPA: GerMN domain-containing protein [Ilumatobacteraceae bacterium]|nr:GerMN domain-containing protein [Ilumatobacteraceae bacterium]